MKSIVLHNNFPINSTNNHKVTFRSWMLVIPLFLISPLISLPFILIEVYNRKKYAQTMLALFMGLAGWLYAPVYDSYRHYLEFWDAGTMQDYLINMASIKFDFILYLIDYIFIHLGLPFEAVKFCFVVLGYELTFWIFRDVMKRRQDLQKYYFPIFLIFFLTPMFTDLTIGMRQMQASIWFFLGMYLLCHKNNWGYLWMILACCLHYSFLIYILPFILLIKCNFKINNKWVIICSLIAFMVFSEAVFDLLIMNAPIDESYKLLAYAYIYGEWGDSEFDTHNQNFLIFYILTKALVYVLVYTSLILKKGKMTELAKFSIIIMVAVSRVSFTMYGRFGMLFVFIGVVAFFLYYHGKAFQIFIPLILFCAFLQQSLNVYDLKSVTLASKETRLVMPVPYIFSQTYSKQWVNRNLNIEGYLKTSL